MDLDTHEVFYVDFGTVKCGSTYVQMFSDPHFLQIEEITKYEDSTTVDTRFHVSLDEKDSRCVKIKFIPERPSSHHCTYFKVLTREKSYNICLKGSTEDLIVTPSKKLIEIKAENIGDTKMTCFNLLNCSKSIATFQFQLDDTQSDIAVKPRFGKIPPTEITKITVTFTPTVKGINYRILYCFIQHHPPIVIEIQTSCQRPSEYHICNKLNFIESIPKPKSTFQYLFDVCDKMDLECVDYPLVINAPVLLDRKYLDFGAKTQSSGDAPVTTVVTATNLSPVNILVKWQPDRNGVFEVIPSSTVIARASVTRFTVNFNPTSKDNFFSATIIGVLHWGDKFSFIVPFHLSLNLLGHSFDEDSFGWLGEFKLPKRVIMPPSLPGLRSWTTITLRKCGHLPLMFRFKPADITYFRFEPEHGVISEEFQIVIIEFTPRMSSGTTLREKIKLILNTSIIVDLELIGTIENPNLWFPNSDKVVFPPTPVNCTLESCVQVKNVTRHLLRYNFETRSDDLIRSKTDVGFILPGEQTKLWLSFSPNSLGSFEATRYLQIACQDLTTNKIIDNKHLIQFTGSAVDPKLTCVPMNLWSGNVHRDEKTTNFFVVSNCSECTCFIKLRVVPKESLSVFKELTFEPDCFTLNPRKEFKVYVTVLADTSGYQSYEILAIICQTPSFKPEEEILGIHLLNLNYFCYSYKFRIVDIINLDGDEPAVPKYHLWNILNVDGLNDKMKRASTLFTEETVEMKVPEYEIGLKALRIGLILENLSDVPCTFQVVKLTPCFCPPFKTKTGYILARPDSMCPHRSQVHFDPSTEEFQPKEKKTLTLTVFYNDATVLISSFQVSIFCTSHPTVKHQLTLNITRCVLGLNEGSADICQYNTCLNTSSIVLKNVFIGTPCPPIQAVWFYNNSENVADYCITIKDIKEEYLQCCNPIGEIPPRTLFPVFLKFLPLCPVEYKAKLVCQIGENKKIVMISGSGVLHHSRNPLLIETKMPFISSWTQQNAPIFFSTNHLVIDNMSTHAITKRIFQLNNQSDQYMSFKWKQRSYDDLVKLSISPEQGNLEPHENVTICIKLESFHNPFVLTLSVFCRLIFSDYKPRPRKKSDVSKVSKSTALSTLLQTYLGPSDPPNDTSVALPNYLYLTVGVNCSAVEWLDKLPHGEVKTKASWKLPLPQGPCLQDWNFPPISPSLSSTLTQLFSHIILDTLESKRFQSKISERIKPKYYSDVEAASLINARPCRISTPRAAAEILDEALIEAFTQLLQPQNKST